MSGVREVVVLQSAQSDYRKIKSYVTQKFGTQAWSIINDEWRSKINQLAAAPELGKNILELDGTGFQGFRRHQHKNAYVVYLSSDDVLTIYMFIPNMRDFRRHLMDRLLDA
jgi:plasmid stabilization system protein ParE